MLHIINFDEAYTTYLKLSIHKKGTVIIFYSKISGKSSKISESMQWNRSFAGLSDVRGAAILRREAEQRA